MLRCAFCNRPVIRLYARFRGRLLFDFDPVEVLPPGVEGWVPGRRVHRGREVCDMAPVSQVSAGKAAAARRFMVVHRCEAREALETHAGLTHNV
jgi:hypothetical protein